MRRRGNSFEVGNSRYPAARVAGIIIRNGAQITTQAVLLALKSSVPIVYLTGNGSVVGITVPFNDRYVEIRLKQYEVCSNPSSSLEFARPLIASSLTARAAVLEFLAEESGTPGLDEAAEVVGSEAERVLKASSRHELRGYEGRAVRRYFRALADVLPGWAFSGRRTRRPPKDPFNAALSLGYTLLSEVLVARVVSAGLDPFLGFLHRPRGRRPGFVLDLMEEWRALAVDVPVLWSFLEGGLTEADFRREGDAVLLREPESVRARVLTVLSRIRGGLLESVDRRIGEIRRAVSRSSPPDPLEFDEGDVEVVWEVLSEG
ncbi:CRISPR-associated endonuclease Cas1 [Methanopyrus sp.]